MRTLCCALAILAASTLTVDAQGPTNIPNRARGADRVVVAQVTNLTPSYETNQYGDRVIVSHVELTVEETLKGKPGSTATLDVLGGTFGGFTLEVSDEPKVNRGQRGVFFMRLNGNGKYVPHGGDQGVLELDAHNHVKGTSLDLDSVKQQVASAASAR